jgi:hypothetical protein
MPLVTRPATSWALAAFLVVLAPDPRQLAAPERLGVAEISRVMLGWASDPATSRAVTWRTSVETPSAQAQIALDVASPNLTGNATTVPADSLRVALTPSGSAWHHVARFGGLRPATSYVYRVGDGTTWSEWFAFSTAHDKPMSFRFLYFGDAQNGLADVFPRTVRAAFSCAPKAALIVHAGDLLAEGYDDRLWEDWMRAFAFVSPSIPHLPVPGNHDEHRPPGSPDSGKVLEVSPLWWAHFALPANGPSDLGSLGRQFYYLDYQGVRFISLDVNAFANEDFVDAARARVQSSVTAWLRGVLTDNPNRWTVLVQHQPLYDVAKDRDYGDMRAQLGSIYDEFHVDLVLQGHDHAYARSWKLRGGKRVRDDEPGTVYVLSVAGSKMYDVTQPHEGLMARIAQGSQMFQVVDVDDTALSLFAYGADGAMVDSVRITKPPLERAIR